MRWVQFSSVNSVIPLFCRLMSTDLATPAGKKKNEEGEEVMVGITRNVYVLNSGKQ